MNLKSANKIYRVSYFIGDRLESVFVEEISGSFKLKNTLAEEDKLELRLHVVLRPYGFVKTFSVTEGAGDPEMLVRRTVEEIPHLVDEMIYHVALQPRLENEHESALLFGVSKASLEEQMQRLNALGEIPDAVCFSTEILHWIYRNRKMEFENSELPVLSGEYCEQTEHLEFRKNQVLQSRWMKKEKWEDAHGRPSVEVMNRDTDDANSVSAEGLMLAAVEAYQRGEVFDFTPLEWERRRSQFKIKNDRTQFLACTVLLLGCLLIYSSVRTVGAWAEIGILQWRNASASESVKSLKEMRLQAAQTQGFFERKNIPIFLFSSLRESLSEGVFIKRLEYQQEKCFFEIRAEAMEEHLVQKLVSALQENSLLRAVKLQRLETSESAQAVKHYEFEIQGWIKAGGCSDAKN